MLSTIEKVIFLKEVPFFHGLTIEQVSLLAASCEEELYPAESHVFHQGDPGGILYVIVSGKVAVEQAHRRGHSARIATLGPSAYFGEVSLFGDTERNASVQALQDTLLLKLRREPVAALVQQHPDLSLAFIQALSDQLRGLNEQLAQLTRTRPREIHKLLDQFE